MDGPGIIRDSVNGENKYCRIPIRRRRTALYSYELEEILYKYMGENGVDTDAIKRDALELFENNNGEDAGILCSVLDFMDLFERLAFADEKESVNA